MPVHAHPNCRCCIVPVVTENEVESLASAAYNGFTACYDDKVDFHKNKDVKRAIKSTDAYFVRRIEPRNNEEFNEMLYGENVQFTKPLEGYYDIKAHGNYRSIKCFNTGINAETLAKILVERSDYTEGTPIRLLSCETGRLVNGRCFAQDLANMLNVEVIAPDIILFVSDTGVLKRPRLELYETKDFKTFTP